MEASFEDLAERQRRRAVRARQQRRRRLRRRADAPPARRRRLGVRARRASRRSAATRAPTSRFSAGSGLTVVEIADSQAWELHFSEIRDCDADRRRDLRHRPEDAAPGHARDGRRRHQRVWHSGRRRWTCRPGMSADTPRSDRRLRSRPHVTVTLGAPKLPLVLPPAEMHAGDIVIADIGIPDEVIEAVDGPHIELLTRGTHAALVAAAAARLPQGRLRSRARDRRLAQGRSGAAHLTAHGRAAIRRRARDDRDAGMRARPWSPPWRRST